MDLDVSEMGFVFCDKHPHEPDLEVIKRKQPVIMLNFESETELMFYNLEARTRLSNPGS